MAFILFQPPAANGSIIIDITPITGGTDGAVLFQKSNKVGENLNFFWDNTNNRLGVNEPVPDVKLHVTSPIGAIFKLETTTSTLDVDLFTTAGVAGYGINSDAFFIQSLDSLSNGIYLWPNTAGQRALHILATGEIRLEYNTSNYINFITQSSGRTAINVIGTIPYLDITPITIFGSTVQNKKGADLGSGTDLILGADGNTFIITGNTTINAISTNGIQAGTQFTLIFTGSPTVKNNTAGGAGTAPFLLNLSVDLLAAPNTVLTVVYDGTNWQQISLKIA